MISESRKALQESGGESEQNIQAFFFEWVEANKTRHPDLAMFYAIPNAAKRGKFNGWMMKLTGTRKGVPDVHLPVGSGSYIGLWFEFKSAKGKLSPEQKEWIARLSERRHRVYVVRSWTDAVNITIDYLGLPLKRL